MSKVEQLIPLEGRILVEEDAFKYEGKIIVPDKVQRRPTTGYVRSIGQVEREIEVEGPLAETGEITKKMVKMKFPYTSKVSVGDHVLYAQFSGTGIQLRNQPAFRVLSEDEILLKLVGDVEVEEISA